MHSESAAGDVLAYVHALCEAVSTPGTRLDPRSEGSPAKSKFAYPAKRDSKRPAAVREKSVHYRNKR
jgi:hypothetical protein